MKLIINIPEEDYKGICHLKNEQLQMLPEEVAETLIRIANGIPLPKGHGRLIDADEAIQRLCGKSCGCTLEECGYEVPCFSVQRINLAPTIIEAESEKV